MDSDENSVLSGTQALASRRRIRAGLFKKFMMQAYKTHPPERVKVKAWKDLR